MAESTSTRFLFILASCFRLLACDSCAIGKAKTVFLGVGVGIGIGVALLRTDPDSDPDPES
jgi:hypothetical protein